VFHPQKKPSLRFSSVCRRDNGIMQQHSNDGDDTVFFQPKEIHVNDDQHNVHGNDTNNNSHAKPTNHWYGATIIHKKSLTPTVTGLTLRLDEHPFDDSNSTSNSSPFQFWPGQWVDFYVPSLDKIGGYSLTSIPRDLPTIDLAVKVSRHQVAQHVYETSCVGDRVRIRVGGNFVYHREEASTSEKQVKRILLIAGGVGINPLFGMMRQIHSDVLLSAKAENVSYRVALLYSASCEEELLFMPELRDLSNEFPHNFQNFFTITRPTRDDTSTCLGEGSNSKKRTVDMHRGRITPDLLQKSMEWLNRDNTALNSHHDVDVKQAIAQDDGDPVRDGKGADAVYICGPPGMAENYLSQLCSRDDCFKVDNADVHFEQWW